MVITSLMAEPSRTPSLMSLARSAGVTSIRLGSLFRRIRFSAFRYSTIWTSSFSVAWAKKQQEGMHESLHVGRM